MTVLQSLHSVGNSRAHCFGNSMRWFHNRYPHSVNVFDVKSIVGKIRPQIKNCWDSNRSEFLHEFDALRYAGYLLRWKNRCPCRGWSFTFTFKRYGHFWSRRRSAFVHKLKFFRFVLETEVCQLTLLLLKSRNARQNIFPRSDPCTPISKWGPSIIF